MKFDLLLLYNKILANSGRQWQLRTTLYIPESQRENAVAIGVNDVDERGVGGIQSRVDVMT